ncbi:MAG: hypothetical protein GY842_01935, partial [bacterium]|nr:hypothetical protein [bacterium]
MRRSRRSPNRPQATDRPGSCTESSPGWPRRLIWLPVLVVVAGSLAYSNSTSGPFIFDDLESIPENPHIRQLWPLGEALSAPQSTTVSGRPLVSLSLALNYAVGGLEVESYHAFNLLIHLLSGLLVAGIVRRTLLRCLTTATANHTAAWLAGVISVIWTVHPLQTDSVTYVIQRTELMAGCCYLLALYGAIRGWS